VQHVRFRGSAGKRRPDAWRRRGEERTPLARNRPAQQPLAEPADAAGSRYRLRSEGAEVLALAARARDAVGSPRPHVRSDLPARQWHRQARFPNPWLATSESAQRLAFSCGLLRLDSRQPEECTRCLGRSQQGSGRRRSISMPVSCNVRVGLLETASTRETATSDGLGWMPLRHQPVETLALARAGESTLRTIPERRSAATRSASTTPSRPVQSGGLDERHAR
jgi:hypothetical protein